MAKKLTLEDVKERTKELNIEVISEDYVNFNHKLTWRCKNENCNHTFKRSINAIGHGYNTCPVCNKQAEIIKKRFTIQYCQKILDDRNINMQIISKEYINNREKILFNCKTHKDEIIESSFSTISQFKGGCPKCKNEAKEINRIKEENKNRLCDNVQNIDVFLKNKQDRNRTCGSHKKIELVCPDCGKEKVMSVSNLYKKGFSCNICGDNVSLPEKFCANLLQELGIEFSKQKIFDWAKNKRYDFYIPSLNIVIETHGGQHYKDWQYGKCSVQKENDLNKMKLAINNGLTYIDVDCRHSDLYYLSRSFINSLSSHFDFSNIDMSYIFSASQKNLTKAICDKWNESSEKSITILSDEFKVSKSLITRSLKTGATLGWCNYDTKQQLIDSAYRSSRKIMKKVYKYTLDGEYVCEYESQVEASKEYPVSNKAIHYAAKHGTVSCGYLWKFEKIGD